MEIHRRHGFDKAMFFTTLALMTLGLIMVFSTSGVAAAQKYNRPLYFLFQQVLGAVFGLALIGLVLAFKKPFYQHPVFVFGLLLITLGLLCLCFLMPVVAGTNRWIILPGFRFQPSELAKISLVLFLAWYLDLRKERIQEWPVLLVPLGVTLLSVLLILNEPDFGTALLTFGLCAALLFLGGLKAKRFAALVLFSLPLFIFYVASAQYRIDRLLAFFSPAKNLQNQNFQVAQSKLAVGAGGLIGVSLGESTQKMFFLPCAHTDFIFAIIGEELGFLGALATLVLFIVILWRGVVISMRAPNLFSQLTAAGLTLLIAVQALLNISVVLGLSPAKGVPLPFLSFGRSSLMINLAAIAILLHISQRRETNRNSA